jgi:hypothetical protein
MNYAIIIFFIIIILVISVLYRILTNNIILGTYKPYPKILVDNKPKNIKGYIGIIRHGTRYPTKNVFKQLSNDMKQTLTHQKIGELHVKGMKEMYDYGKYLSNNYPNIFSQPENIKIFSTNMNRSIDSAKEAVKGLNMEGYVNIEYNDNIESFLKLKNILKEKTEHNPYQMRCQFSEALDLPKPSYCSLINYSKNYDKKNRDTYKSIVKTHEKGYPFYHILLDLIEQYKKYTINQGCLFFCHDSTLAPIYYLLNLLPDINKYQNDEWLPFAARLEIMISNNNEVYFFVNDKLIRKEI